MMRKLSLLLVISLSLFACAKEEGKMKYYKPKFVVEGWIEEGAFPYVMLSHNLPFFTAVDSAQLAEVVIRWAKVSVSDGENTEILSATKDSRYFPPYGYKGSELKGVAGKTYTLKIEYAGNVLTAETRIEEKPALDSIWFSPKENGTKQQLNVRFKDNPEAVNYYRLFTRQGDDQIFYPTLLSVQSDKNFNGKNYSVQVNRGPKNNLKITNEPFFNTGDTVFVKFASIPESAFKFWSSFNDEVIGASNPLVGSTGKINHNIQGPAIGIWTGYNSTVYRVIAK
ncbi:DUF4249 domain-containing protein [Pelobium manganitolerans]|uniref:DUF4249 domain-containing protein n=1 Tax=Pelobium manganitolerans TaxID=1842495 RepID=UPI003FA3DD8C